MVAWRCDLWLNLLRRWHGGVHPASVALAIAKYTSIHLDVDFSQIANRRRATERRIRRFTIVAGYRRLPSGVHPRARRRSAIAPSSALSTTVPALQISSYRNPISDYTRATALLVHVQATTFRCLLRDVFTEGSWVRWQAQLAHWIQRLHCSPSCRFDSRGAHTPVSRRKHF